MFVQQTWETWRMQQTFRRRKWREKQLGRPKHQWKDTSKMDLKRTTNQLHEAESILRSS
jgi:hypothetical protein